MIHNKSVILQRICIAISIPACFILQSSVFPHISLGGVSPNLMLLLTVFYAILYGENTGITVGFFCGLLIDIFSGNLLGFHALLQMYLGYACGQLCGLFYPEDIRFPLVLLTLSDFTYGFGVYVFSFLLHGRTHFSFYLRSVIAPETFYTALVSIVFYSLILKADQAFENIRNRSDQTIV